jgi:hypothetical protein
MYITSKVYLPIALLTSVVDIPLADSVAASEMPEDTMCMNLEALVQTSPAQRRSVQVLENYYNDCFQEDSRLQNTRWQAQNRVSRAWPLSITNTFAKSLRKGSTYCSSHACCRRHTSMIVPNLVPYRRTCATRTPTQPGTRAISSRVCAGWLVA